MQPVVPVPSPVQHPANRRLSAARQARGWTQKEVAERIGATELSVSRWERGTHAPSPFYRFRLCALFGLSEADLGIGPQDVAAAGETQAPAGVWDPSIPLPPVGRHALVGRALLLARLKAQVLAAAPLARCGVHGLPGVGKTALAVALAHDRAVQAHFSGGILWAGLGPQPNVPMHLARWAGLLGVSLPEHARGRGEGAWGEALRAAIGRKRVLLVLDDAWSIEAALQATVGGPQSAYLLTTRLASLAAQFAAEEAVAVPELDEADSLALLGQLAPAVVATEPEEARRLALAVGGLPLAISLLGSELERYARSGPARRLRAALERFHHAEERLRLSVPLGLLESPTALAPGASLSLQASIALSDEQLDPGAQLALRSLSVFASRPNGFSEEAALAVTGTSADTLDRLVDSGLLEAGAQGRYSLHPTIADYARENLENTQAPRRFVEFFAAVAKTYAQDFEVLEPESHNLFTALEIAFNKRLT
jgi:transcriptional regulator with XRE-family HTH domain